jgi:hypothetical protein
MSRMASPQRAGGFNQGMMADRGGISRRRRSQLGAGQRNRARNTTGKAQHVNVNTE